MESLTSGTMAGTGSFRCEACGHVVAVGSPAALERCPDCGGTAFTRASLFATGRFERPGTAPDAGEREAFLAEARGRIAPGSGRWLAFRDGEDLVLIALKPEWTRIGRSLAADIRFDDATVSRRHVLIAQEETGVVRVLDDRSLNGVFVNGERVERRELQDGDELIVGRHRLTFLDFAALPAPTPDAGRGQELPTG